MSEQRNIAILGSTGTIGVNALDVIARHPQRYRVAALAAHKDVDALLAQCEQFHPQTVAMGDVAAASELRRQLQSRGLKLTVHEGVAGLCRVAALDEADTIIAGIVGAAGLRPSMRALAAGKRLLMANKEPMVMAGGLFLDTAAAHGGEILPVDSEHNAVFQCLPAGYRCGGRPAGVKRLILTASGGPFRDLPVEELEQVTPEQAVTHPNWEMGRKISVDSATMMNKGLEVMEACWLFGMDAEHIEVIVHPQSVIHSLVEYADGSFLAQLGSPDMRTPIASALAWPQRIEAGVTALDLLQLAKLEFQPLERSRYPCFGLALEAMKRGGLAPAAVNAANEVAVAAFLDRHIGFGQIAAVIAAVLAEDWSREESDLKAVIDADARARKLAHQVVERRFAA